MMKQYIFKLLWVAVPALIFCVFSSWVLYKGGELKTLDRWRKLVNKVLKNL